MPRETVPWRVRVEVATTPAAVARVMRVIARLRIDVPAMFTHAHIGEKQLIDMFIAAPRTVTRDRLIEELSLVAESCVVIPGEAVDSEDIATRVLEGAARIAGDPQSAPQSAAALVVADSWETTDARTGEDASANVMRLQWTPTTHVILRRAAAPFTTTERSRASALLKLVEALATARGDTSGFGWFWWTAAGAPLVTRLARPEDVAGVAHLHDRCSEDSLYQRYFTPASTWREENLRRISGGHRGGTLVVTDQDETIVALANVFPELSTAGENGAEVALLVADSMQGGGIGKRLLEQAISLARRVGFDHLVAYVLAENNRMTAILNRSSVEWHRTESEFGSSVVRWVAPV